MVEVALGKDRPQHRRPAVGVERPAEIAGLPERTAENVQRLRRSGIGRNRAGQACAGRRNGARLQGDQPPQPQRVRVVRHGPEHGAVGRIRFRQAPLLVQRHRLPEARGKILHARRLLHLRPVPEQLRLQETLSLRERQSRASHPSDHC